LAASQQQTLKLLAGAFNTYVADHPDAQLVLTGHADRRGPNRYNQALSARRAAVVKNFLVKQGVAAERIDTHAFGEEQNLKSVAVKQLITQNPDATDQVRQKALQRLTTMVYAHNRRVDMKLNATGQESVRNYPFTAEDFAILVKRGELKAGTAAPEERENVGD
jgi:outer membrane protein OmpA-like peptidoglycan-associated protein